MKRVFIIHGWDGHPEEGWFPWLKRELENRGFTVQVPQLPDAADPRIQKWIPAVAKTVGTADGDTYFVGHSMGCQAIARYLEQLPDNLKVGGAVFVAGFFKHLQGLEDDPEVRETDRHWLGAPIELSKVRKHLARSIAIFSDNDPWVPLDNQEDFHEKLGSEIVIEHGKRHFSGSEGFFEVPVILESVLRIAK